MAEGVAAGLLRDSGLGDGTLHGLLNHARIQIMTAPGTGFLVASAVVLRQDPTARPTRAWPAGISWPGHRASVPEPSQRRGRAWCRLHTLSRCSRQGGTHSAAPTQLRLLLAAPTGAPLLRPQLAAPSPGPLPGAGCVAPVLRGHRYHEWASSPQALPGAGCPLGYGRSPRAESESALRPAERLCQRHLLMRVRVEAEAVALLHANHYTKLEVQWRNNGLGEAGTGFLGSWFIGCSWSSTGDKP